MLILGFYYNNSEKFRINYRSHAFFYMFSKDNNRIPLSHTGFDVINEEKDFTTYFPQMFIFFWLLEQCVCLCHYGFVCYICTAVPAFTAVFIWMVHGRSYVYIQHACFFVSISVFLPCWSALFNSAPLSFSLYAFFEVNLKDQHQSFISYKRACCLLMWGKYQ